MKPDFSKGLVPAVVQDADTGQVLMLAYMDEEAWSKTRDGDCGEGRCKLVLRCL